MIFYEVTLLSVPQILFACSVEHEHYRNRFAHIEDFLEIAMCEQGRVLYRYDDGTEEIVEPGMTTPILEDIGCHTSAYNGERQWHTTVGVRMKYRAVRHSAENCDKEALLSRMREYETVLIPYHMPLFEHKESVIAHLRRVITAYGATDAASRVRAVGEWYVLAAHMTEIVLSVLSDMDDCRISPSVRLYASRAEAYMHDHYAEALTVEEIARHTGISKGYLHHVFRTIYGYGVLECLNRYRISLAVHMIEKMHVSLGEAGKNVGIDDPLYMSRLFKKTTGQSYRQYFAQRRLGNEE